MSNERLGTPVALFIYNRPSKTERVLDQISTAEPQRLLVVSDGPQSQDASDIKRCERTREVVRDGVDWKCDVAWNTTDTNMGLKHRFVTGLRWIFQREHEAIILEDDCVPNESFFNFCSVILDEYRDDERIMDVSGSNHLGEWKPDSKDYHFSMQGGIWGWATWRRSWELYDPEMKLWRNDEIRQRLRDVIADNDQADYLEYIYDKAYSGEIETWDYPWGFARQINSALSVVPSKNLVTNIGFGEDATNTSAEGGPMSNIPRQELSFPIEHPKCVAVDREFDRRFHQLRPMSRRYKLFRTIRDLLGV